MKYPFLISHIEKYLRSNSVLHNHNTTHATTITVWSTPFTKGRTRLKTWRVGSSFCPFLVMEDQTKDALPLCERLCLITQLWLYVHSTWRRKNVIGPNLTVFGQFHCLTNTITWQFPLTNVYFFCPQIQMKSSYHRLKQIMHLLSSYFLHLHCDFCWQEEQTTHLLWVGLLWCQAILYKTNQRVVVSNV